MYTIATVRHRHSHIVQSVELHSVLDEAPRFRFVGRCPERWGIDVQERDIDIEEARGTLLVWRDLLLEDELSVEHEDSLLMENHFDARHLEMLVGDAPAQDGSEPDPEPEPGAPAPVPFTDEALAKFRELLPEQQDAFVEVRSKREGDTYATVLTLTDEALNHSTDVSKIPIPVSYEEPVPIAEKGTRITLRRLKSDALRDSLATIEKTIARSFHAIRPADFAIKINGTQLTAKSPDYEFVYPPTLTPEKVKAGELADDSIEISDIGTISIRYHVGFLPRSQHLKSAERGARVYCNNRLAAGPTLFDLGTGMHSFHSTDYMECVVEADELDRDSIDLINTARTQFKEGNEIVDALRAKVTQLMSAAISAHGRFREEQAKTQLDTDPKARIIMQTVRTLPAKSRKAATKLLTTMASQWGVGTEQFEEIAPTIVHSINATDVLIRLVSKGTNPETIGTILGQLRELSEIEKRDTLKLYRGRRGAIEKLEALAEQGLEQWRKRASEKALHNLFKECPWLIRPEFSNYIASDNTLTTTVSRIARELQIDEFAEEPAPIKDGEEEDTRRPDLVFVMSDPMIDGPHTLKIVELKSPSLPLTYEHYRQLEDYMTVIKRWCQNNLSHSIRYHGYLIGAMPKANSSSNREYALLEKYRTIGPRDEIQILGLNELIRDARTVHVEAIRSLEKDLAEEDERAESDDGAAGEDSAPMAATGTELAAADTRVQVEDPSA